MDHGMDPVETQLKEAEKIIKDYEYHMVREPRWHVFPFLERFYMSVPYMSPSTSSSTLAGTPILLLPQPHPPQAHCTLHSALCALRSVLCALCSALLSALCSQLSFRPILLLIQALCSTFYHDAT